MPIQGSLVCLARDLSAACVSWPQSGGKAPLRTGASGRRVNSSVALAPWCPRCTYSVGVTARPHAIPAARIIQLHNRLADGPISRDELRRELREIVVLVSEYAPDRDSAVEVASSADWAEAITPDFIDHAIQVSQVLGTALIGSWAARADNRVAQAILRRRRRGRRATASQARSFALFQLNVAWDAGIRASDEAASESLGPDGWSFTWQKGPIRYTATGDHNLDRLEVSKSVTT